MAYDEALARRVRIVLSARNDVTEKRMFGGLTFMVGGHMCCGIVDGELMVRVGPAADADARKQPHARACDFTGRPMKGLIMIGTPGVTTDGALAAWVGRGLAFTTSLPPK